MTLYNSYLALKSYPFKKIYSTGRDFDFTAEQLQVRKSLQTEQIRSVLKMFVPKVSTVKAYLRKDNAAVHRANSLKYGLLLHDLENPVVRV